MSSPRNGIFFRPALPPTSALAAVAFIGAVYALKYAPGADRQPFAALAGYLAFFVLSCVAGLSAAPWLRRRRAPWAWIFSGLAVFTVLVAVPYSRIEPSSLQLDRWSALQGFWDALFRGDYPYAVLSHLGNALSGFPGLFALALPFHALGDVGLLQFAALFAFAALLRARLRDPGAVAFVLILLLGFPPFLYEILVRSDLFANMTAVAWLMHVCLRPGAMGAKNPRLWLWAVLWGLALSTRAVAVVPLLLTAFPLLRGRSFRDALISALLLGAVFLATFLPLYLWDPALFREHNPFRVQSLYIPLWALGTLLAACLFLGHRYRAHPRVFAHTGFLLLGTVTVCGGLVLGHLGGRAMLWGNGFNVTYFSMAIPFLFLHLGERLAEKNSRPQTVHSV